MPANFAGGLCMESQYAEFRFYQANKPCMKAQEVGFRFGNKGTHTSRTMMLAELEAVLDATGETAERDDYTSAIIDGNCLSKATAATRRLSSQRLSELYGLDPKLSLFRVLRRLSNIDRENNLRLALLAAIARDPLLAASAPLHYPSRSRRGISARADEGRLAFCGWWQAERPHP